jgi:hypothetical protein
VDHVAQYLGTDRLSGQVHVQSLICTQIGAQDKKRCKIYLILAHACAEQIADHMAVVYALADE